MREKPREFWTHDCLSLRVTDAEGLVLFSLQLSVTLSAAINGRHPTIESHDPRG